MHRRRGDHIYVKTNRGGGLGLGDIGGINPIVLLFRVFGERVHFLPSAFHFGAFCSSLI